MLGEDRAQPLAEVGGNEVEEIRDEARRGRDSKRQCLRAEPGVDRKGLPKALSGVRWRVLGQDLCDPLAGGGLNCVHNMMLRRSVLVNGRLRSAPSRVHPPIR